MVQNKDSRTLLQAVTAPDIQRSRSPFPLKAPGGPFPSRIACSIGESQERAPLSELESALGSAMSTQSASGLCQKIREIAKLAGCGCTVDVVFDKLDMSEPTLSVTATIQTFNPRIPLSLLAGIADLLDGISFSLNSDKRQYTVGFTENSARNVTMEQLDRLAYVIVLTKQSRLA